MKHSKSTNQIQNIKRLNIRYRKNSIIRNALFLLLTLAITISGCTKTIPKIDNNQPAFISKSTFLLNTSITINLYDIQDEKLINGCFDLIADYENIYSRTAKTSEVYQINHGLSPHQGLTYPISSELTSLLQYGLDYSRLSGGAFDITVAPLTSLWDFTSLNPVIPPKDEIKKALSYVGYQNVTLIDNKVTFSKEGMGLEFGAIAKGYIADRVKDYLLANGVKSAIINLGGNILCLGSKPDGSPFTIGIQKPFADRNETIALMDISDLSVVSSGIYERFFSLDQTIYHHILNPQTGYPYENDLISVTIISKASVDGDGLSTSCFALGLEDGLSLINSLTDTYAVFITKDYKIYYSDGFKENINVKEQ